MTAPNAPAPRALLDKLGDVIETLSNLNAALQLSLRAETHTTALKGTLPSIEKRLKEIYMALAGDNPWE